MLSQAAARALLVFACVSPSLLCFGLAVYLMTHGINEGWGWLMLIGFLALEAPGRLFKLPEECPTCHARRYNTKPHEEAYEEVA